MPNFKEHDSIKQPTLFKRGRQRIYFSKNCLKFQNSAKDLKTFARCLSGRRRLAPVTTSSGSPATPSVEDLIDFISKRKYFKYC